MLPKDKVIHQHNCRVSHLKTSKKVIHFDHQAQALPYSTSTVMKTALCISESYPTNCRNYHSNDGHHSGFLP
jgi:hypothetical protein